MVLSFFLLIILLILGLIFSKIKINVKKLYFNLPRKQFQKNEYWIDVGVYLFGKVKIFGIEFQDNLVKIMGLKITDKTIKNSRFYKNIAKPEIKEFDKKILIENVKKIYVKFEKLNLDLSLGTDSTLVTSFLIFAVSTVISLIVKKGVTKYNPRKHKFKITPKYENYNVLNINLDCVISLKTSNIVRILLYLNKISKQNRNTDELINKNKHYPGYV